MRTASAKRDFRGPGLRRITKAKTSSEPGGWNPSRTHAIVTVMRQITDQFRRIKKLLRLRGATSEDAEDLVQEAVLRLHVYTCAGNDVRDPTGFVARTAVNLAIDAQRHAHGELYESTPLEELTSIVDARPTPDEVFAAQERLIHMRDALDHVSRRTREVFFMHRLQGYSHAEIAKQLGISKSAVEKHIASAMTLLAMERRDLRDP